MDIEITVGGGVAGGPPMRIATDRLPVEMRARARALLAPKMLEHLQRKAGAGAPSQPDRLTYELRVVDEDGNAQTFAVPEEAMTPEQLDLLDDLMAEAPSTARPAAPAAPAAGAGTLEDDLANAANTLRQILEAAEASKPRWNVAYRAAQDLRRIADVLVERARKAMEGARKD